ncbi:bifunctional oligoribonuclease/PAP phosphatase NrnA [bacterium]|nr:bifunctional oligoribonuclease/PAP phosphatase NrnA [bacterium]
MILQANISENRYSRMDPHAIFEIIGRKRKVLIICHNNPDPDTIASAYALQYILREKGHKRSLITYSGHIGRFENREFVRRLKINLVQFQQIDPSSFSIICLIDTQPRTGNNPLPLSHYPQIVIDHHPLRHESTKCLFADIRPDYGSTSTIMTEYCRELDLVPSQRVATALFYGLKTDTNNLLRSRNRVDYEAFTYLFPLVSLKTLANIENPTITRSYLKKLADSIENSYQVKDALICDMGQLNNAENVAELAELLIRVENIRWTLCLGEYSHQLFISVRTSRRGWYAGTIAMKILRGLGFGGGHEKTAGGNVPFENYTQDQKQAVIRLIVQRFLNILALSDYKAKQVFKRKPDGYLPDLFPEEN